MNDYSFPDAHLHVDDDLGELSKGSFVNAAKECEWQACLDRAEAQNGRAFLGVHPWYLDQAEDGWLERLGGLAKDHAIGIGEIGLDRFRGPSLDEQLTAFDAQLAVAMECRRPVSVHCVKRWGGVIEVLSEHAPFSANVMIHGFAGPAEIQGRLLELGCYLSFGFDLIDGNNAAITAWKHMPEDRVLLESDAPDSLSKRRVEVSHYGREMGTLLEAAASLRGTSPDRLGSVLSDNASSFLGA